MSGSYYLTERELMEFLNVSRSTARRFADSARVKIGSRTLRYDRRIVEELLAESN